MVLIELTAKSSLVLAAALVAVAVMRHRSAATRHIVLASAFVTTLALPAIVVVGPHWQVPSLSRFTKTSAQSFFGSVDGGRGLTPRGSSRLQALQYRFGTSNFRSRWRGDDWVRVLTIIWLVGV